MMLGASALILPVQELREGRDPEALVFEQLMQQAEDLKGIAEQKDVLLLTSYPSEHRST
jgi:hypothetical protein